MSALLTADRTQEIVDAVRAAYPEVAAADDAGTLSAEDIVDCITAESWYHSCAMVPATAAEIADRAATPNGERTAAEQTWDINEHDRWLRDAPAAEIAEWIDSDALLTIECAYCGAETRRAPVAYISAQRTAAAQIDAIAEALAEHQDGTPADDVSWGAVGDLGHVNAQLAEVLAFLQASS